MRRSTVNLALCALFAALIALMSQIQIPLPYIPINLATLAIYLAGALLPYPYGVAASAVYVLMGLIGLPVFAGMQGGVAVLFGKTGGYIIGYVICAGVINFANRKATNVIWRLPLWCLIGTALLYAFGTIWFMFLTHMGLMVSLSYCVFPFIAGDLVKIVIATLLEKRLRPAIRSFHR